MDVIEAEVRLMVAAGEIEKAYTAYQHKLTVGELPLDGLDENARNLLDILKPVPLDEAITYLRVLGNAISQHVQRKNMELKVNELGITLLDVDEEIQK